MLKPLKERLISEKRILLKHWLALIFFIIYFVYFCFVPARNFVFYLDRPVSQISIEDIFHNILPQMKSETLSNFPQALVWLFTGIPQLFIPLFYKKCHKVGVYVISSALTSISVLSVVYFIRIVTYYLTIMPDPSYMCSNKVQIPRPQNLFGNFYFCIFRVFYEDKNIQNSLINFYSNKNEFKFMNYINRVYD